MIVHLNQKLGEEKGLLQFANQNVLDTGVLFVMRCDDTPSESKPFGDCGPGGMVIVYLVTYLIMRQQRPGRYPPYMVT